MRNDRDNVQILVKCGLEKLKSIKSDFPQMYEWLAEEEYFPHTLVELNIMEIEVNEAIDRINFADQYLDDPLDIDEPVLSYYWLVSDYMQ